MSTNAGELLTTMKTRHEMQRDGVTNPSATVKHATSMLVEKLSKLSPKEKIIVEIRQGSHVYIQKSTKEILAKFDD